MATRPPDIVDSPALSTQDVEIAGLIIDDRGHLSPGPGTRTRNAASEARKQLSQYFQAKSKHKLTKRVKQVDIYWDVAIARELVKKPLFKVSGPDSDTVSEDIDPGYLRRRKYCSSTILKSK